MTSNKILTFYVDDKSLGSLTVTWTTMSMERLGGAIYPGATYYLPGNIDFAHVYNRALSANELASFNASPYCMFGNR